MATLYCRRKQEWETDRGNEDKYEGREKVTKQLVEPVVLL